jgi:hypothetical protein
VLYLLVINKELYTQATKELQKTGCTLPNPLDSEHARTAYHPAFTLTLRQHLANIKFHVEPKSLGGASCYDPGPSNFYFPPSSSTPVPTTPPAPA